MDEFLATSEEHYDYVIIDCPPSLGLLVINAMCAVHEMLIPIQAEYYALEGLGQLINTIGLVQEHYNPSLLVSTMLITMYDKRTLLSREVHGEVKKHYPTIVLDTTIPRTVKISEAPSFNQSVIAYDPKGMGAIAYCEAALELSRRSDTVLQAIDARRNENRSWQLSRVWVKVLAHCFLLFRGSRSIRSMRRLPLPPRKSRLPRLMGMWSPRARPLPHRHR